MAPITGSLILWLLAAADVGIKAVAASPNVVGYNFKKSVPRNTPDSSLHSLRRRDKTISVDLDNAQIAYIINMTIGTPPQPFSVQIDTGSADIWIPSVNSDVCQQTAGICQLAGAYDSSASSTFSEVQRNGFSISYADGSGVFGDFYNDTVTIGKTTIQNMTMGLGINSTRALGIMGIGYDQGESIAATDPSKVYPNIITQLQDQGFTSSSAYSLWLNDLNSNTGSILFGGVDTAKYHGNLIALPVQKGANGSYIDFTVALSSVSLADCKGKSQYSSDNLALPVILDSGTTDTYLPDNLVQPILSGVGAVNDPTLGSIVPCSLANSPATFAFGFGGQGGPSIQVSFGEFVSPVVLDDGSQPTFKDGSGTVCSFGLLSSGSGAQPILLGDTFLRSAYVVYDLTGNTIALAQTNFNTTGSNVVEISGSSIPGATATATAVAVSQTYTGHPLQTNAKTKGGSQPTGKKGSPTFNLCVSGATGTSAAAVLDVPRIEVTAIVTGFAVMASLMLGGSLVALI